MSFFLTRVTFVGVVTLAMAVPAVFAEDKTLGKLESIFDGATLNDWEARPEKHSADWTVGNGMIVAENEGKAGSVLWTKKNYTDYVLELEYQTTSDYYDTGVMLRGDGHQVQIGISGSLKKDMTGCIYAPKDKKGGYPGQTDKVTKYHKPGEWNHLKIILAGKRIQTFVNGEPFVDYTGIAINEEGPIGLQLHAGHHMKILFKNIRLNELASD